MFREKDCAETELHPLVVDLLSEDLNLLQVSPSTWPPLPSESIFFVAELKGLLGKSPKISGQNSCVFMQIGIQVAPSVSRKYTSLSGKMSTKISNQ